MSIRKIACISMAFPAPSETFHSNNLKVLSEYGKEIVAFSLLPKDKNHKTLIEQRNLSRIKINSCNWINSIKGLFISLGNPWLTITTIGFILSNITGKHLVKSLALLPRVFYVWSEIVFNEKPDVVNLLWGHYPSLVGFLVKKTNPEILLSMGLLAYDLEMNYGGSRGVAPYVDTIWTQASVNIKQIRNMGFRQSQVHVIYDGLDVSVSEGKKSKTPFRIITAGRLIKSKGTDLCLKAFALVANSYPQAKLVVLGEGPERKNLENLARCLGISGDVHFKGHVSMEEVAEELSTSDLFLFMSQKERLPNVVKEALLNKAICVVSPTPGIEELIQEGETGFILKENTPKEAAVLLTRIFSNRPVANSLREAGYRFVLEHFDCRKEMKKLLSVWEDQIKIRRESTCESA